MIPFAQAAAQAAQSECCLSKWFCGAGDGNCGLILYGALIGFAICLVIWLIVSIYSRNKNVCKDITIEDSDKGTFVISSNAMKTFAERIVSENTALKFIGLRLVETRLGLVMKINLSALPDAELLPDSSGGYIVDTPGFSMLESLPLEPEELPNTYYEFNDYKGLCRFTGCMHISEPDCAVKAAVEKGEISSERYLRYKKLANEAIEARRHKYD